MIKHVCKHAATRRLHNAEVTYLYFGNALAEHTGYQTVLPLITRMPDNKLATSLFKTE